MDDTPHSLERKIALLLQGGGALGSDQSGVCEALCHWCIK